MLRGTGTWTAYFSLGGSPWLAAGWAMVTSAAGILGSAAVSAVGLAGLARRDMPERRWLCVCVGLVTAVALAGYYGPLGGPWHAAVDDLLNGTLAPFRSLYKIEPVIAVALALGCAHVMPRVWQLSLPLGRYRLAASAVTAPLLALAMIGLAWPQLTGQTLEAGSFQNLPRYWYQTAAYLARHSARDTALVVPADPHGQFTWGNTIDDPLEPLATSPWVERGLVPYGGAGSQVLLATAEQAIESGQQVPGLAPYLARAGIRYVVVRNDIATSISGYTPPQVVNETLAQSGFRRVAGFGPAVAAAPTYPALAGAEPGFALSYPAVEVFEAADSQLRPASPVTSLPVSQTVLVNGGPDSLLQLDGQGILGSQPTVIAGQHLTGTPALWAVTDGQRRADNEFGATAGNQSYTYTATGTNPVDDPLGGGGGPPRQLLPVAAAGHQTVAALAGAASVTASSAGAWLSEAPQYDPANAFDGSASTAWAEASPATPVGQWIQVSFGREIQLPSSVGIRLLDDSPSRAIADELKVSTAAGTAITATARTGARQQLRVPPGPSSWLRVTILGADRVRPGGSGAGIADVLIPGVRVTTYLQPAEDLAAGSRAPGVAYSFGQQAGGGTGAAAAGQQLDRVFVTPAPEVLTARVSAVPVAGRALATLLSRLTPAGKSAFRVTADSTWKWLPVFGPDGMYEPARLPWISRAGDRFPRLTFSWHGRRTITKIVLRRAYGVASTPTSVLIGAPHAYRLANVGSDGVVRIRPPLRTDKLYLIFRGTSPPAAGRQRAPLPVGLAGVTIRGLAGLHPAVPDPATPFQLSCGQGPDVVISGRAYPTSVRGTLGDLIHLEPVQVRLCSPAGTVTLAAGQQRLSTGASSVFTVTSLSLSSPPATGPAATAPARKVDILAWGAESRAVRVGPGPASYVEIHEDFDAGWTATLNGRRLQPATLDGWQQAFIVPAGQGGTITLSFRPAVVYHAGLIASALALLVLAGFALGVRKRRGRAGGRPDPGRPAGELPGQAPPRALARTALAWAGLAGKALARTPLTRTGLARNGLARTGLARTGLASELAMLLPLLVVVAVAAGPMAIVVPVLALLGRWRPGWLPYVAAAAMLATGVVVATSRVQTSVGDGPFSGTAQALALVALTAALMPAIGARDTDEPRH